VLLCDIHERQLRVLWAKKFIPMGFVLLGHDCKSLNAKDSLLLLSMATTDTKVLGGI
jgi:hypothetical protein